LIRGLAMDRDDIFLDAGMRGWIVRTAKREYWRVAQLCDFPDLVQDGYLCYAKCRRAYLDPRPDLTGTRDEKRWFQSLVKTTYTNHIHTLAAKHKGVSELPASQLAADDSGEDAVWARLPSQPELGTLQALVASAPAEIKQLMILL